MATWRQLTPSDVSGLMLVADVVHPGLPEAPDVFTERVGLFPQGCLVLSDGARVCGYAISHPIRQNQPPALNSLLGEIPSDSDQYYIHDLAILPEYRGTGLARDCILKLLDIAKPYRMTCLISVYGTDWFWGRYGFVPEAVDERLREKLRAYGDGAVFLSRENSGQ